MLYKCSYFYQLRQHQLITFLPCESACVCVIMTKYGPSSDSLCVCLMIDRFCQLESTITINDSHETSQVCSSDKNEGQYHQCPYVVIVMDISN